jgi:hypothetical protein
MMDYIVICLLDCIMRSTPIPDLERSKNLSTSGESKKTRGGNKVYTKRGKGTNKKHAM